MSTQTFLSRQLGPKVMFSSSRPMDLIWCSLNLTLFEKSGTKKASVLRPPTKSWDRIQGCPTTWRRRDINRCASSLLISSLRKIKTNEGQARSICSLDPRASMWLGHSIDIIYGHYFNWIWGLLSWVWTKHGLISSSHLVQKSSFKLLELCFNKNSRKCLNNSTWTQKSQVELVP